MLQPLQDISGMVNPDQVSLVAMGYRAKESAEEDFLCAEYINIAYKGY